MLHFGIGPASLRDHYVSEMTICPKLKCTRFCGTIPPVHPPLRDAAIQLAARHSTIDLVYRFGSRARGDSGGNVGPMSDYDVAVLLQHSTESFDLQMQLQHEVCKALDTDKVDLMLLNRVPIELAWHVIARGKLLFARSKYIHVEYEANVMSRYGDYLPVLRAQHEDILQRRNRDRRAEWVRASLERAKRTFAEIGDDAG